MISAHYEESLLFFMCVWNQSLYGLEGIALYLIRTQTRISTPATRRKSRLVGPIYGFLVLHFENV